MSRHLRKAYEIFSFYVRLLARDPSKNLLLVLLGFFLRGSSVVIFALTVKAFLVVIDPQTARFFLVPMLDYFSIDHGSQDYYVKVVLLGLSAMVLVQFLLNLVYQKQFIDNRQLLVKSIIDTPLCSSQSYHEHVVFDLIPQGFESIVKALEIVLFYASLVLLIFVINSAVALLLVVLLGVLIFTMLAYIDERSSTRSAAYNDRQTVDLTGDEPMRGLRFADHVFNASKRSSTYSELFGGMGMVLVMLVYVLWFDDSDLSGSSLVSIVLVLSVRFLINYTGEISRLLGAIFQQYSMLAFLDLYHSRDRDA